MKALEMLNKVKELVGVELETEKVTLAQATLKNGTVLESESFEKGSEVFIVTEDERVALPVGSYELEDGEMILVKEEGIIESIGKAEEEVQEKEEELSEEVEVQAEEEKEEMQYATKTELEEVKKLVEEVKDMVKAMDQKPKEEMSAVAEPPQKITHSPEKKENKVNVQMPTRQPETTYDRVLQKIANINK